MSPLMRIGALLAFLTALAAGFIVISDRQVPGASAPARDPAGELLAGLGDTPGQLAVSPFDPPAHFRIVAARGFTPGDCSDTVGGVGDQELCLQVCNDSDKDEELRIPSGVSFTIRWDKPEDSGKGRKRKQNVMTVGEIIRVPGGNCRKKEEEKDQSSPDAPPQSGERIILRVFCLNVGMGIPDEGDQYEIKGRTQHPDLLEILRIIENKSLDDDDVDVVQDAIWAVTDYGGLTDEHRARLQAL